MIYRLYLMKFQNTHCCYQMWTSLSVLKDANMFGMLNWESILQTAEWEICAISLGLCELETRGWQGDCLWASGASLRHQLPPKQELRWLRTGRRQARAVSFFRTLQGVIAHIFCWIIYHWQILFILFLKLVLFTSLNITSGQTCILVHSQFLSSTAYGV